MKLVILTGIPGSGSTTVLEKTLEEVDYLHLNYGDVMTKIAKDKSIVKDRDDLRKLSPEIQKNIQKEAAKHIKDVSQNENVIVDTHCTISTPLGFLPGLPKWVLDELNPDTFILIEADPDEIILRRISDISRTRDMEKYDEIRLHQEINRSTAMSYSTLTGATVKILENHDDQLDIIVDNLVATLK
ncbi:cytidylate kinase [Methanobrevibacter cuticularis]|uniref:Adenylate kinase n=1 Tax=Methanobrevibacter cuticularis TaxID=47311 RepID=A0A166FK15_9EURY|nr:adenylate kinase [Methanobrevibacter cuticularis]KZX17755.1 cytidylate kinase [Methanobrevibacter cuticularis]